MSDAIGTVRQEKRGNDYWIWVRVGRALVEGFGARQEIWVSSEWLCIDSSVPTACGARRPAEEVEVDDIPIVATIPGTAAETATGAVIGGVGCGCPSCLIGGPCDDCDRYPCACGDA